MNFGYTNVYPQAYNSKKLTHAQLGCTNTIVRKGIKSIDIKATHVHLVCMNTLEKKSMILTMS